MGVGFGPLVKRGGMGGASLLGGGSGSAMVDIHLEIVPNIF